MLRFGVIGYGYWGPNIVRNLRSLEGCEVVGICDHSPAARNRIQSANPGVPVYSDHNELVSSSDVDAIAVITPVWTHFEVAKAALQNGKHVFVEKPLALTWEDCQTVQRAVKEAGVKTCVCFECRFSSQFLTIKAIIEDLRPAPRS